MNTYDYNFSTRRQELPIDIDQVEEGLYNSRRMVCIKRTMPAEVEEKVILRSDVQKVAQLEEVMRMTQSSGNVPLIVPEYCRQQSVLSEVATIFHGDEPIEIEFPPVGAEKMTTKVIRSLTVNSGQGIIAGKNNETFLSHVIPVRSDDEEVVVFSVLTRKGKQQWKWEKNTLVRVNVPHAMWLRKSKITGHYYNMTSQYGDDFIMVPDRLLCSILPNADYLCYVDGVPWLLGAGLYVVLAVKNGIWSDKNGKNYGQVVMADGNYYVDLNDMIPRAPTTRPPDSTQIVTVTRNSVLTTSQFLQHFPRCAGTHMVNYDNRVIVVDYPDTTFTGYQIMMKLSHPYQKLIVSRMKDRKDYRDMKGFNKVVIGHTVYSGYRDYDNLDVLYFRDRWWTTLRLPYLSEKIFIPVNKHGVYSGAWFEVRTLPIVKDDSAEPTDMDRCVVIKE